MSKPEPAKPEKIKAKGTIGIAGLNPIEVAVLNKELIRQANLMGLDLDQKIPEIIAIGIASEDVKFFGDAINICADYGCDLIAIAHKIGDSKIKERIKIGFQQDQLPIEIFSQDELSIEEYAKKILTHALSLEKPRRPNLVYGESEISKKTTEENLLKDRRDTTRRIKERMAHGGYPLLAHIDFQHFIILGGAGPAASAAQAFNFSQRGIPYIHISANNAPGKHLFEMGQGPSYVMHHQNSLTFAATLGLEQAQSAKRKKSPKLTFAPPFHSIIIPCNTVHRRLSEFCTIEIGEEKIDLSTEVIDIRNAALSTCSNTDSVILIGTSTSVGRVGDSDDFVGTYEIYRRKYFDDSRKDSYVPPFIIPNQLQQEKCMEAIFKIKAGEFEEAKKILNGIIAEIRSENGNAQVFFVCTELPLAYTKQEMLDYKITDPSEALARMAKEMSPKTRQREYSPAESSSHHTSSEDMSDDSASSSSKYVSASRHSDHKKPRLGLDDLIAQGVKIHSSKDPEKPSVINIKIGGEGVARKLSTKVASSIFSKFSDSDTLTLTTEQDSNEATIIADKPSSELRKWLKSRETNERTL